MNKFDELILTECYHNDPKIDQIMLAEKKIKILSTFQFFESKSIYFNFFFGFEIEAEF